MEFRSFRPLLGLMPFWAIVGPRSLGSYWTLGLLSLGSWVERPIKGRVKWSFTPLSMLDDSMDFLWVVTLIIY